MLKAHCTIIDVYNWLSPILNTDENGAVCVYLYSLVKTPSLWQQILAYNLSHPICIILMLYMLASGPVCVYLFFVLILICLFLTSVCVRMCIYIYMTQLWHEMSPVSLSDQLYGQWGQYFSSHCSCRSQCLQKSLMVQLIFYVCLINGAS